MKTRVIIGLSIAFLIALSSFKVQEWGFYGHRKINKMAIFTLPSEMFGFFKTNIDYITEHSVDPDKRRYATKHEAVRHYIDIDHWGENPFESVPQDWDEAMIKYGIFAVINGEDTVKYRVNRYGDSLDIGDVKLNIDYRSFLTIFRSEFKVNYYDGEMAVEGKYFNELIDTNLSSSDGKVLFIDKFSEYGICPYHLKSTYHKLKRAFENRDERKILRTAAEYGHYIGDAHVPLHTTENYNGQLTGQDGIHAFWESRIVELFDNEFDFFVGKARYIEDINEYVWKVIKDSHMLVDSVLLIEKRLRNSFPEDQQYCYDERLQNTIRIQCEDYARFYMMEMDGMVESRMTEAVRAIGSLWYTAWVDAGQPDLNNLNKVEYEEEVILRDENIKTRIHE